MKRTVIAGILFLIAFIVSYLVICFAIPGMRIKLEAGPVEYFVKSIRHMAFLKTVISCIIAGIAGGISFLGRKKQ